MHLILDPNLANIDEKLKTIWNDRYLFPITIHVIHKRTFVGICMQLINCGKQFTTPPVLESLVSKCVFESFEVNLLPIL